MKSKILKYPDVRLFQLSGIVMDFKSTQLQELIDNLSDSVDILKYSKVLCALQLGVALRVMVYKTYDNKKITMINPSVFSHIGTIVTKERCDTFDNLEVEVKRFETIKIMYQDINLDQCFLEISGEDAIFLQRVINMMFGELLVDKLDKNGKKLYESTNSYEELDLCPTNTNRGKLLDVVKFLIIFQLVTLLAKNIFGLFEKISQFNLHITIVGFVMLFIYALYTKYETTKYKSCTSCQGANMIGNFIGYGATLVILSIFNAL